MLTPLTDLTPAAVALACRHAREAITTAPTMAEMTPQAAILRIECWRVLHAARGGRIRESRLRAACGLPPRAPVTDRVAAHLAARMTAPDDTPPGAA